VPSYPIEHVMKTPELTDEQRASILGDNGPSCPRWASVDAAPAWRRWRPV